MTWFFKKRKEPEDALLARLDGVITALGKVGVSQPSPSAERGSEALLGRLRELEQTVKDIDADLDWLTAEVKKMRGKVTGGQRRENGASGSGEEKVEAAPERYSREWFRQQREKLGLRG